MKKSLLILLLVCSIATNGLGQKKAKKVVAATPPPVDKLELMKQEAIKMIDDNQKLTQEINDMLFSYSELGFQEFESLNYLTSILEKNGFKVEKGVAGMPTAWMARWGSGSPVIAIGSDIDCIPKASQKPGVAYKDPIVEGAPGHGEGHNSGQALNITAVLAVKAIMEKEKLPGTIVLWPGVAEEQVGAKAIYVRDGYFKDVDACIFTHVGDNMGVAWGDVGNNGLVSVKFHFEGAAAHAAGAPWKGRSALDAVELMNIGWNFKREHLETTQRSHYVISDGGDQPNVVPSKASVWYYFRERSYPRIKNMFDAGIKIANGAAMMTDTKFTYEILGSAWPGHFNKPIALTMQKNIERVGLPTWSKEDQLLAKSAQKELGVAEPKGLAMKLDTMPEPVYSPMIVRQAGSDDIADISWSLPTVVLRYPSNLPNLPGHHWANAITMATPIAHKGCTAGAKVEALTLLDMFTKPEIIKDAKAYYADVQTKNQKYEPLISASDKPAIQLNREIMAKFKEPLSKFYYDPAKYKTYLEQLGIQYPTVREEHRKEFEK
jgi:aminobenzoyl-glutamate utilization protein B